MALDPKVAPAPLILPSELPIYGAGSDFLGEFTVRAILIKITTPGALGTMQFTWQIVGDANVSQPVQSEAGAPWPYALPDLAWCGLIFADGAYGADATYTVSRTGTVSGPNALITATRIDLVQSACEAATGDAVTLMQPRCVAPIISIGSGHKKWLAKMVIFELKFRGGFTPPDAGTGDDNVVTMNTEARKVFAGIGASAMRPPDLVDSSTRNTGAGLSALPISDPLRGWD